MKDNDICVIKEYVITSMFKIMYLEIWKISVNYKLHNVSVHFLL